MEYIYPQNLREPPHLWLWDIKSLLCGIPLLLVGVLSYAGTGWNGLLAVAAGYYLLAIRNGEESVFGFLQICIRYFLTGQQSFQWQKPIDNRGRK